MAKYHFSVSQKKTMDSCLRKWFIEKICKVKQPESKALKFGKTFHTGIENFIKTGKFGITDTKALRMLKANLTLLNSLNEIHNGGNYITAIEYELKVPITPLTEFLGYVDFFIKDNDILNIQDHKTAASWTWVLNKSQLKEDLQMNVYGHLLSHQESADIVILQHNQFSKKVEGKARVVEVEMDDEQAAWSYACLVKDAKVAEHIHETMKPEQYMDVSCNHNACTDYGGCPYYSVCHFNKKIDLEKGMIMEPENSFFGRPEGEMVVTSEKGVTETSESLLDDNKPEGAVDLDDILGDAPPKPEKEIPLSAKQALTQSQTQTPAPKETENVLDSFLDETPKTGEKPAKNGKKTAKDRKTKVKKVSVGTMFVINVLPITQGVKSKTFGEILAPFAKSIAEKNNVADIRTMEFNAGVKELLYYNTEILEECKKEGMIIVDGYNKMEMDAFSYLELDEMCIALRGY